MTATEFITQDSLFDSAVVVRRERLTAEESFAKFCRRNAWFLPTLAERAFELRIRGARRLSMKQLFEEVRGQVTDQGTTFRLNNDWTALASRRLVELYPDLGGLFSTRKRKS